VRENKGGLMQLLNKHQYRALGVATVLVILVSCSSSDNESASTTVQATDAPTSAPTTTAAPATTTTVKPTGTEQSCGADERLEDGDGDGWGSCVSTTTTTTVDPADEADLNVLIALTAITSDKQKFADLIKDSSFSIESVDLIDVVVNNGPPPTADLEIAVTSGYNGIEYRDEIAWTLARNLSIFWESNEGALRNDVGSVKPGLVLTVDTTRYVAPYDLMVQVADLGITSTDWLAAARQ
jgi:hypothetical protein